MEKPVCVLHVPRSSELAFMKGAQGARGKEFYVRVGNTITALDPEQTVAYLETQRGGD